MVTTMLTNSRGIAAALGAAVLFGASTPAAKILLSDIGPWLLAGLLYLGSGVGLMVVRFLRGSNGAELTRQDWPWMIGAVAFGGVAGPVLLMWGLSGITASTASLLLNAEGVLQLSLLGLSFVKILTDE